MATLRDIKRRIKGVQSTQKITKAMKMVAAAKLRRAQDNIINARPYAKKMGEMLANLITPDDTASNPFLMEKNISSVLVVVVTGDRGLCGAFNINSIKEANRYIEQEVIAKGIKPLVYCVGKKSHDFFKKKNYEIVGNASGIFHGLSFESSYSVSSNIISGYLSGKYERVVIVFNEFKSIIKQNVTALQYLPIQIDKKESSEITNSNFIFEPSQKNIFEYILPKHLNAQFWKVLLESNAAEFAARMTAMENATTNAKEMIRTLNLKYNKERQAAITKEILEVVSGANALT